MGSVCGAGGRAGRPGYRYHKLKVWGSGSTHLRWEREEVGGALPHQSQHCTTCPHCSEQIQLGSPGNIIAMVTLYWDQIMCAAAENGANRSRWTRNMPLSPLQYILPPPGPAFIVAYEVHICK